MKIYKLRHPIIREADFWVKAIMNYQNIIKQATLADFAR